MTQKKSAAAEHTARPAGNFKRPARAANGDITMDPGI